MLFRSGNGAKLTGDIMKTVSQITGGLKESTGVDVADILKKFAGVQAANDKNT